MGAGVIPFCVFEHKVLFLFQTVFVGRKTGFLNDFGGGLDEGEDSRRCAIREFVEETETMYFADELSQVRRTAESVQQQLGIVERLFDATLQAHPDWWCRRAPGNPQKPKRWKSFFVGFPYRDIGPLNREWRNDRIGRFKKRRELHWIESEELLEIYASSPKRLWKRVRQLEGAAGVVREIQRVKG